jgi:trigger factor
MKINKLLETMMQNTPVEIPGSMLRMELDSRWRNMARRFNTDTEGLFKIFGGSERSATIIEGWKPEAIRSLHSRLIVETLIEEMKLEASDEEVEKEIERLAQETNSGIDEVKKYYEAEHMREYLKEDIKERKVYEILLEKNTIKTVKMENNVDLAEKNE